MASEAPPPGAGVTTRICRVPGVARSAADTSIVRMVVVVSNVGRVSPSISISDVAAKSDPMTVSRNSGPPAVIVAGEIAISFGAGGGGMMASGNDDEVPPLGECTLTCFTPIRPMSLAVIDAATRVGDSNVVVRSASSSRTIEPGAKPDPVTVSQNVASPATTVDGERLESVGRLSTRHRAPKSVQVNQPRIDKIRQNKGFVAGIPLFLIFAFVSL